MTHHFVLAIISILSLVHLQEGEQEACYRMDCTDGCSLIAVMLGTLRMDIQTCIDEYLELAPQIFPVEGLVKGSDLGRFFTVARGQQRFKAEPLEMAIRRLVKKHLGERSAEGEETLFRFEASKLKEDHPCNV